MLWVHVKENIHPAAWKAKLKKIDPDTYKLNPYVTRSGDSNWLMMEAKTGSSKALLDRLAPLRKCKLTVEVGNEEGPARN